MATPDPFQRVFLVLVCILAVLFPLTRVQRGRKAGRGPRKIFADVIASLGLPVAQLPLALGMPHGAGAVSLFVLGACLMAWEISTFVRDHRRDRRRAKPAAVPKDGGP